MQTPVNRFKQRLRAGETLIGLWAQSGHAAVSEVVADVGFDWLLIDGEHAPLEVPTIVDQLRVIEPTGTPAIVRPAWNDPVMLKRVLDTGVQTLLVPYVQTAEEARRAVASARYPPEGTRGVAATIRANRYGRVSDYHGRANDEICVLVQLETGEAVARLEEIGRVAGVDGLFIGPSDLAASLGHLGHNAHPEVRGLITEACRRAHAIGVPIGILATVEADARAFLEMGFQYVAVGSDIGVLRNAADQLLKKFR
jgi:4-hydroxy-2-oxoheptanedioate aldolase